MVVLRNLNNLNMAQLDQDKAIISQYILEIEKILQSGDAREHAYRPAFQKMIKALMPEIQVINEPAYTGGNAPDFLFKKGDTPIAYAECKDVTVDIQHKDVQKQAKRYVDAFGRILLTNYFAFEIIHEDGESIKFSIAEFANNKIVAQSENFESFINLLRDYIKPLHRTINSAKKLAEIMASKARLLRDNALASLIENTESDIFAQYMTFKEVLINDLTEADFADMYAQTIVYGLFVARYFDPTLLTFSRHEAHDLLPSTNPLLKKFFGHVAGTDYDPKIAWLVDSLIEAYLSTDVHGLMHKEFKAKQKDPVLHFYETFLTQYDQSLRKSRGVYYTPEPVVSFIVRSVDQILKTKFNLPKGLADTSKIEHKVKVQAGDGRTKDGIKRSNEEIHKVQILDPAVGTGTFLNEVIHHIHSSFKGQEGMWQGYVKNHLLSRLHGFELMMASYTMAHLKLGVTLAELGYEGDERLSVWLTNSLEESVHEVPNLFMSQWLTDESNQASRIKSEMPIMVVLGNPPYSGVSANNTENAIKLADKYKIEPGGNQKLQERKHWLNDDYVKFISFAENQIAKTQEGIVAFVTNHGYIDNPTFRGMRWHLLKTFDEIYIVDLHGNSIKKETAPDGGKDENVFDIMQGVAIILAFKKRDSKYKLAKLWHSEIFGKRKEKYEQLDCLDFGKMNWKKVNYQEPYYFFVNKDFKLDEEYNEGFSIEKLFPTQSMGITSARDNFVIDIEKESLVERILDFTDKELSNEEFQRKYALSENYQWKIAEQRRLSPGYDSSHLKKISYRPFDDRIIYFQDNVVFRSRRKVMEHLFSGQNYALNLVRAGRKLDSHNYFVTKHVTDKSITSSLDNSNCFPLYLCHDDGTKTPNLDKDIIKKLEHHLTLEFTCEESVKELGDLETPPIGKIDRIHFTPEDVLDYIYAVLHSPSYREKYKEFLKIDFPRVPYPKDKATFWNLVKLGRELRGLHLLESPKVSDFITTFPVGGSNIVEKKYPNFENGNVYINEIQYFGNVPELAWNFYIGGYQPAQKWIKDRRELELSMEDIEHYQQMIVALSETGRVMREVDEVFKI